MSYERENLKGDLARRWYSADGLRCGITPAARGTGNGYVQLPEGHPDLGKDHDDIDVEVHGGLSYGCDRLGWVGFDTGHAWDVWPGEEFDRLAEMTPEPWRTHVRHTTATWRKLSREFYIPPPPHQVAWTIDRLVAEVEHLALGLYARAVEAPGQQGVRP